MFRFSNSSFEPNYISRFFQVGQEVDKLDQDPRHQDLRHQQGQALRDLDLLGQAPLDQHPQQQDQDPLDLPLPHPDQDPLDLLEEVRAHHHQDPAPQDLEGHYRQQVKIFFHSVMMYFENRILHFCHNLSALER